MCAYIGANLCAIVLGVKSCMGAVMAKVRKDLKRHLAAEIAAAILEGDYRPGEWLRQIDLEETFAAKRFDVRSALGELAARGMVSHVANRGYRVTLPNLAVVREMQAIRILLEVEAAAKLCRISVRPSSNKSRPPKRRLSMRWRAAARPTRLTPMRLSMTRSIVMHRTNRYLNSSLRFAIASGQDRSRCGLPMPTCKEVLHTMSTLLLRSKHAISRRLSPPCAATLQNQGPTIQRPNAVVIVPVERRLSLTDRPFSKHDACCWTAVGR